MKIAICLSGQMRNAIYAWPNIKKFLGNIINSADFFIHTWDINSEKSVWDDDKNRRKIFFISNENLVEYIDIYKPKNYKIEKTFLITESNHIEYLKWHSLTKSIQLKKEYEINNKFDYDIVIKLRPDMIVEPSILIDDIINQLDFTDNILFANDIINGILDDVIWVANSKTMDKVSEYPFMNLDINLISNSYWHDFAFYLQSQNISSSKFAGEMYYNFNVISDKWSIMRTEAIPYHSVDEYKKCLEIDRNIYWNPDSAVAPFMKYLKENEWKTIIKNMFQHKGFIPKHLEYLK
jgi:hypothetical protein